jgi:hypothetical protein
MSSGSSVCEGYSRLLRTPRISFTTFLSKVTTIGSSPLRGISTTDALPTMNSPWPAGVSDFCSYFRPFRVLTRPFAEMGSPGRSTSGWA